MNTWNRTRKIYSIIINEKIIPSKNYTQLKKLYSKNMQKLCANHGIGSMQLLKKNDFRHSKAKMNFFDNIC